VLTPEVAGRWRVSVRLTSGGAGKAGENASKDEGRVAGRVSEEGASVMNPNDLSGRELMKRNSEQRNPSGLAPIGQSVQAMLQDVEP
jgi:hypothetical protein